MSVNEKYYYVMNYDSTAEGCPVSMAGFFNCERFEWEPYELNPERLEIKHDYSLTLTFLDGGLEELDFDFHQVGATYVSKKFLDVCDKLGAKYRAVPLELKLGKKFAGAIFLFFCQAKAWLQWIRGGRYMKCQGILRMEA